VHDVHTTWGYVTHSVGTWLCRAKLNKTSSGYEEAYWQMVWSYDHVKSADSPNLSYGESLEEAGHKRWHQKLFRGSSCNIWVKQTLRMVHYIVEVVPTSLQNLEFELKLAGYNNENL